MAGTKGRAVPARIIPVPTTISPEAQMVLAGDNPYAGELAPAPDDIAAWEAHVAAGNARMVDMLARATDHGAGFDVTTHRLAHAPLYEIVPQGALGDGALLYVHGGGYTVGGGMAAAYAAMMIARLIGLRTYSIDYRMPPAAPFPAAVDDAVDAYRWTLARHAPARVVVYGPSAGGGLAACMLLKARDVGLPLPAGCVLHSPEADLTEAGDTFETNLGIDGVLSRLTNANLLYAGGHDLSDPYLSPLFGDFAKGFPPTLLSSGTRDLFLSNTVLMHRALRRAGVSAELHVWEAMGHAGFFGAAPEDREVLTEQVRFLRGRLGLTPPG